DNEMNREIASYILSENGLVVEHADDGDVAVEMVRAAFERGETRYYDAVLMDIQMPRMDGFEATRAIRALASPDGSRIPIIAMTANAFEEDRQKAFDAGMDAHLAKPIDVQAMLETLVQFTR
ncbi:MAG: response regulator, partial [Coriobacteriaceae bacterium]|nr:response regulator [Coriobacteriaceae bacterium]